MNNSIRVSCNGHQIFEAPISKLHVRTITLLGWAAPLHLAEKPKDQSQYISRIVQAVEDALQTNYSCHQTWIKLYNAPNVGPIELEIVGTSGNQGAPSFDLWSGGDGGDGAWPGGGGGGGGGGGRCFNGVCGAGGNGADGAILIFEYNKDDFLVDIQCLASPGKYSYIVPKWLGTVTVICVGAGGGGGALKPSKDKKLKSLNKKL